jgi:diaminopimelate epimerase
MHANGDDFVIVDSRNSSNPMTDNLARRMGDRNRGVGFNHLAVVLDDDDADARLMFWSSDGSPLDDCGSATRGAAQMLMCESNTASITLRTNRGLLTCERTLTRAVSVDMGVPLFEWSATPAPLELDTDVIPLIDNPVACTMGNPHCTYFVDDLTTIDIAAIGRSIETNPLFPHRTNVHFVQVIDRKHIRLHIWVRWGATPLGSGLCSCGAVVNGIHHGLLDNCVEVECDGGTVTIQWDGVGSVILSGPVETIFSGIITGTLLQVL